MFLRKIVEDSGLDDILGGAITCRALVGLAIYKRRTLHCLGSDCGYPHLRKIPMVQSYKIIKIEREKHSEITFCISEYLHLYH